MKSIHSVLAIALVLAGCATSTSELPTGAATQPAHSPATITARQPCFSGPFGDYDQWIAGFRKTNSKFDIEAFQKRFARQDYDRYKSELVCDKILYQVGELTVEGYSIRPGNAATPLPVVIYNRGGNASYGRMRFGGLFKHLFPLAEHGYFVIASQYRGSGLRDKTLNQGEDEFGGKDVDDVLALFDLIDRSPYADNDRIGMFGMSRGGFMSLLAATRTDRLSAIAIGATPTDLVKRLPERPEMERVYRARIPGYETSKIAELKKRSVLYWVDRLPSDMPILILQGKLDEKVSVGNATDLDAALTEAGIPHRIVIFEQAGHGLGKNDRDMVNQELFDWFDTHLK